MDLYKMAFDVFRERKDVINSVTFWIYPTEEAGATEEDQVNVTLYCSM